MRAKDFGSVGSTLWWSVMIVSMPKSDANSTSDMEVAPQSTVISRETPRSYRCLIASGFKP